ncbi:MAG TPA: hypothetical protein VNY06_03655, partial [Methylocella sp.]|nr:hypothetical protein [Methylocella sp.]
LHPVLLEQHGARLGPDKLPAASRHGTKAYTRINGTDLRLNHIPTKVLFSNDPISMPPAVKRNRPPCCEPRRKFSIVRAGTLLPSAAAAPICAPLRLQSEAAAALLG